MKASTLRSPRLWRALTFLRARESKGATSLELVDEIAKESKTLNIGTTMSELRAKGYNIGCKFERITDSGAKVFRYTLYE